MQVCQVSLQRNDLLTSLTVQSSFQDPCGPKEGGFNSGLYVFIIINNNKSVSDLTDIHIFSFPVDASVTDNFPTYTIDVNDTNPIWVYCAQAAKTAASHCGKGMVFAVNCGADGAPNSFTNFKNSALAVGAQLAGEASASSTYVYESTAVAAPSSTDVATPPASTTAAAAASTHTVIVGGSMALTFNPSEVSAQPNDVVVFQLSVINLHFHASLLTSLQPIEEPLCDSILLRSTVRKDWIDRWN